MTEPQVPGPQLPWGLVTHSALGPFADGDDANLHPDLHLVKGLRVTFTPSMKAAVWTDGGMSHTLVLQPVTGEYDDTGQLCLLKKDGTRSVTPGVRLMATSSPSMVPSGWSWGVAWSNAALQSGNFPLAPDGDVDLSSVVLGSVVPDAPVYFADLLQAAADLQTAIDAGGDVGAAVEDYLIANPPSGGVTAHSALSGLGADDHTQYALTDGSRGDFATSAELIGLVADTDPRLTDDRTPTAHTHLLAEVTDYTEPVIPDAVTWVTLDHPATFPPEDHTHLLEDITDYTEPDLSGKADVGHDHLLEDITDYVEPDLSGKADTGHTHDTADTTSGVFDTGRLGTGTSTSSDILYGDGAWKPAPEPGEAIPPVDASPTVKGVVQLAGDLGGTATAPTVPGLADKANTTDPRFEDARTPTGHATSHATGGADPISPASIGAATDVQGALADTATQPAELSVYATTASLGTAASTDATAYATAAQGALAGTATQPADLTVYATTASLGTAATTAAADYATSVQGAKADTATQPGDLGTAATTDATDYATAVQGGKADTATQPADLGTAATTDSTDYATSAQGILAGTAVQPAGLTAAAVGLGSVDDTADVDKPVSTDTTAAISASKASVHTISSLAAGSVLHVIYATTWPARPTTRTDIMVHWIGSVMGNPPPGAISGVDIWDLETA